MFICVRRNVDGDKRAGCYQHAASNSAESAAACADGHGDAETRTDA